jgi:cbb3-type cytochrome oxidase cytochrome c subunit
MIKISIRQWAGLFGIAVVTTLFVGCEGKKSGAGMVLPEGDIDLGRESFVRLDCVKCHSVVGEPFVAQTSGEDVHVQLGGEVVHIQTYGQLVTAIVNPKHVVSSRYRGKLVDADGKSLMPALNETMTVEELINLVAFLQSRYKLKPAPITDYPGI